MARLQERVQALEHENAGLSYTLSLRENELGKAKEELASLRRGASGDSNTVHAPASAAPGGQALVLLHIQVTNILVATNRYTAGIGKFGLE